MEERDVGRHDVRQVAKPLERQIDYDHGRTKAGGHLRGVGAHHAAAEDDDSARLHTGHAA